MNYRYEIVRPNGTVLQGEPQSSLFWAQASAEVGLWTETGRESIVDCKLAVEQLVRSEIGETVEYKGHKIRFVRVI